MATELLLGIGPDNNLNDNAGLGYDVTVTVAGQGSAVPEPSTITLFGVGIMCVAAFGRCRRRRIETA
jgi:hypothetical protein